MAAIQESLAALAAERLVPIGPRGVGYRLEGRVIGGRKVMKDREYDKLSTEEKTRATSFSTIGIIVTKARRAGLIDWNHISDARFDTVMPNVFEDVQELASTLLYTALMAKVDPAKDQPVLVEVWSEAADLMALVGRLVGPYGISVFSSSGWTGPKAARDTGQRWEMDGRPVIILYVGDLDPDGLSIADRIFADAQAFAVGFGMDPDLVEIRRVAVTEQQVTDWNLSTEPGKTSHRNDISVPFCCQAEAIPPARLRDLLVATVEDIFDLDQLDATRQAWENQDRQALLDVIRPFTEPPANANADLDGPDADEDDDLDPEEEE